MGFGVGGGFSQPGVREVKTFSASSEIGIPIRQSIAIAIGVAVLSFCVYLFTKIFVTTRNDWSLLIGIVTIVLVPFLASFLLKILGRRFSAIYFDFGRNGFLVACGIAFVVAGLILNFYVSYIVPQMTLTLNQEAHIVAFGCAIFGLGVAMKPYLTFFNRQLTNSLRDSDSKYAITSLGYEVEERRRKYEVIDQEEDESPAYRQHILRKNPNTVNLLGEMDEDERMDVAREEFLDALRDGTITTDERSWKGARLQRSRYNVTAIGDKIRDELVEYGYAEWNHPTKKNLGWSLTAEPDEIKTLWLIKWGTNGE